MTENLTCISWLQVTLVYKWELTQRGRQIEVNKGIWMRPRREYTVVYHYSLLLSFILNHKSTHLSCQHMWQIWQHTLYDLQVHWRKPPKVSVLIGCQHGWGCAVTVSHWDMTLMDYFVTEKTVSSHYMLMLAIIRPNSRQYQWEVKFDEKSFACSLWYFYLSWIGKGCPVSKLLN